MNQNIPKFEIEGKLSKLPPSLAFEVESFVINSVKVSLIKKCDSFLDVQGKANIRKLLLVPIFSIPDFTKRVKELAPELHTMYFHELAKIVSEAEKKWC